MKDVVEAKYRESLRLSKLVENYRGMGSRLLTRHGLQVNRERHLGATYVNKSGIHGLSTIEKTRRKNAE